MAKINLLPWREALREQRKKEFISINIGVFLLGLVLVALAWAFFNQRLNDQQQANQLVQEANNQLDKQLKSLDGLQTRRDEIIERMKLIQDLQGKRPVVVRLFDDLVRLTPSNMYLTRFERKGDQFLITGRAESPNTVSEFLRSLESSPWYRNAFMNSYLGVEQLKEKQGAKANQKTSVVPRPEDAYGQFEITVDLAEDADSVTGEPIADTAVQPVKDAAAPASAGGAK
jgi:type IV pilus assembly protein PilN